MVCELGLWHLKYHPRISIAGPIFVPDDKIYRLPFPSEAIKSIVDLSIVVFKFCHTTYDINTIYTLHNVLIDDLRLSYEPIELSDVIKEFFSNMPLQNIVIMLEVLNYLIVPKLSEIVRSALASIVLHINKSYSSSFLSKLELEFDLKKRDYFFNGNLLVDKIN